MHIISNAAKFGNNFRCEVNKSDMNADINKKTIDETSFDQLDWKNGSLTGNGLKQAVDMYKAQDADKQTAVIYDRKSGQSFNIVDVNMGSIKSGHGLEIDIDTSKAIQKESENMKDNEKPTKTTSFKPVLSNGKIVEVNEINPYPDHLVAYVERVGTARSGKWQVLVGKQELLKSPLPRCKDANEVLDQFCEKYWRHLDEDKQEEEVNEATNEDGEEYATISELLYAAHKAVPNSSDAGKHTEIFAVIDGNLELMKVGKFLKAKSWSDTGRFVLTDGSSTSKAAIDKLAKQLHLDESELNEADDNDPLSHALDAVGVKASTANSKSQDEVQMTATDGDTYAGIDVAIDKDIDAAMEEIYC